MAKKNRGNVQKACWMPRKLAIDLDEFALNQRRTISITIIMALEKHIYGEEKEVGFYEEESPKEK